MSTKSRACGQIHSLRSIFFRGGASSSSSSLLFFFLFFLFFLRCTRRVNDIRRERWIPNGSPLRAFHFLTRSPARYSRASPRGLAPVHAHSEKQSRIFGLFLYCENLDFGTWLVKPDMWIQVKQRNGRKWTKLNTFHLVILWKNNYVYMFVLVSLIWIHLKKIKNFSIYYIIPWHY